MKNTINNNEIPTILLRIFAFIAFAVLCSIALSLPSKAQTSNNVEKWTVTKTQVGDYEIVMRTDEELEYILSLIKQSLKKNKK